MQTIKEIMSRDVRVLPPSATVQQAAEQMRVLDIGSVPVCDGEKLVGMITDRDIAVRAAADGRDPKTTKVADVMSSEVVWCYDDASTDEVSRLMQERQVRRIPIVNRDKQLVGIVSLGNVATSRDDDETKARTLEGVSQPG
jgi:CBS domain-containing protein